MAERSCPTVEPRPSQDRPTTGLRRPVLQDHPFDTLSKYLLAERTPSSHFLDFLELSLGPTLESHIARDNEFVDGLNLALDRRASPYLLTRYAYIREEYDDGSFQPFNAGVSTSAYPQAYLKQSQPVQQHTIEPASNCSPTRPISLRTTIS